MSDLIKEGREKLKGVSDAPWYVGKGCPEIVCTDSYGCLPHEEETVCDCDCGIEEPKMILANSDFIAWSRNNIEALLDGFNRDSGLTVELEGENITLKSYVEEQQKQIAKLNKVVEAVKSLNLDKVDGYMLLGKSYKEIICEALTELGDKK